MSSWKTAFVVSYPYCRKKRIDGALDPWAILELSFREMENARLTPCGPSKNCEFMAENDGMMHFYRIFYS